MALFQTISWRTRSFFGFGERFDRQPAAEKILSRFDIVQRFFCARCRQKPDIAENFLTHERHLFRSLRIDCAGGEVIKFIDGWLRKNINNKTATRSHCS
jgi:hypothetical protein